MDKFKKLFFIFTPLEIFGNKIVIRHLTASSLFFKRFLMGLFLFFVIASIASPVLALEEIEPRPLEVQYPAVPEAETPETIETEIPVYVKYIFNLSIWIVGLIALAVIIYGGAAWLMSTGQPAAIQEAKNWIWAAVTGLLLLLSSWLILTTINPELKHLDVKPPPAVLSALFPGVYLCKESAMEDMSSSWYIIQRVKETEDEEEVRRLAELLDKNLEKISEKCWRVPSETAKIPEEFNDVAKFVYTVPTEALQFRGAILYEETNFKGKALVVFQTTKNRPVGWPIDIIKVSSVKPFVLKKLLPETKAEVYVELYKGINLNDEFPEEVRKWPGRYRKYGGHRIIDYSTEWISIPLDWVGSIKIEGELVVVFFREDTGTWELKAEIDVITEIDYNLYDNLVGKWCQEEPGWGIRIEYYPCPEAMVLFSAGFY